MSNDVRKAIIIGAGPAGLLAALQLHRDNDISITIYEIRSQQSSLRGAIGIPSNGLRLLDRLGLHNTVCGRGAQTPSLVIHSLKGHVMGQYEHVSWSKSTTGFGYVRIRRADLMHILYQELEVAVIRIFFGKSLLEIEESNDKITAKFADNTSDTADLLLGCDGLHSAVRKLYVDPGHEPEYTGISNIFSLVSTANLSRSAKTLENLNATLTTDGLVAISPCTTSAEVLYWFLSREIELPEVGDTRDDWEQRGREEVYALKGALLSLLEGGGGEFSELQKEIIDKTSVTKSYPVFRLPLGGRWSRSRCLIIGDAAHAM